MANRLDGTNPLSYQGVTAYSPPEFVVHDRNPTIYDWQNFNLGTIWLNNNVSFQPLTTRPVWILVALNINPATNQQNGTWIRFGSAGAGLTSLQGDLNANVAVPNGANIIDVYGDTGSAAGGVLQTSVPVNGGSELDILFAPTTTGTILGGNTGGQPIFYTLTSIGGTIAITFPPASAAGTINIDTTGSAVGATTIITNTSTTNIYGTGFTVVGGGGDIHAYTVTGADGLVTIELVSTGVENAQYGVVYSNGPYPSAVGLSQTGAGTTGTVLLGNTSAPPSFGVITNGILPGNGAITLNNGNNITITPNLIPLGTAAIINLTGTTQYDVQVGNSSGSLTSIANGSVGQILQATATNPRWATLTAGTGISITNIGGTITITNTGGGGGTVTSVNPGENINITGTAVVPVVNLNEIIRWPATTTDGLHGVIYLGAICAANVCTGGYRFMHNEGTNNTFLGQTAGNFSNTATGSTGVGYNALTALTSGNSNSAFGELSLASATSGIGNTAAGQSSGTSITTGSNNIAIGNLSLSSLTSGSGNNALGQLALENLLTGIDNIAIGSSGQIAGSNYTGAESQNILLSNTGITGESNTMRFGTTGSGTGQVNRAFMAGTYGVTPGGAGIQFMTMDSSGQMGTGGGSGVGVISVVAGENINITGSASYPQVNLNEVISWPHTNNAGTTGAIYLNATCNGTTCVDGTIFMHNLGGTALGEGAMSGNLAINSTAPGQTNVAIGVDAMKWLLAPTNFGGNTAIGSLTLGALAPSGFTGDDNTAAGYQCMRFATTANANCGYGEQSLLYIQTGSSNSAYGLNSLKFLEETGGTGNYNSAFGRDSGSALTGSESNNAYFVNVGVLGESNVLRLGTTGTGNLQQSNAYIAATYGKTSAAGIAVLINSSELLGTTTSSARYKNTINDMGSDSSRIYDLRPVTFKYNQDSTHVTSAESQIKQFGLIAEEVEQLMPDQVSYDKDGNPDSVRYLNLIPMLLNEVQKIRKELDDRDILINKLIHRLDSHERGLDAYERELPISF